MKLQKWVKTKGNVLESVEMLVRFCLSRVNDKIKTL